MIAHAWDYAPAIAAACILSAGLMLRAAWRRDRAQPSTTTDHVIRPHTNATPPSD